MTPSLSPALRHAAVAVGQTTRLIYLWICRLGRLVSALSKHFITLPDVVAITIYVQQQR